MNSPTDAPELAPNRPIPSQGEVRIRVRYCECDPMGVAHHSSIVPWFEIGRTELLRQSGLTYAHMEQRGVLLVVARLDVRYRSPAKYDDLLVLETTVSGGGRARVDHAYELWRDEEDGRGRSALLATGSSTLACVDTSGSPRPLPEWLRPGSHV